MNFVLLFSLLVLINTATAKPTSEDDYDPNDMAYEDDRNMQKDDYPDDYDDDSGNNNYEENEAIPVIVSKPEHLLVKQHTNVTLSCALLKDRDMLVLLWKKQDTPIFQDSIPLGNFNNKFVLQNNSSLVITDVNEGDSGEYTCEIAMKDGPKLTHTVTVEGPAKILALTADRSITEYKTGDTISLTCNATGIPTPNITWSFKGLRKMGTGNNLIIENIGMDDSGAYQCLADNKIGLPAHESINILVNHLPIVKIERLVSNIMGDSYDAELRCIVRSSSTAIITWKKNGEILPVKHRKKNNAHSITIHNVQESDFGKYTCSAQNQMGKHEEHYFLTSAPNMPNYIEGDQSRDGKEVTFKWNVESLFPISKHELLYKIKTEGEWREESPEVEEPKAYIYNIKYKISDLHPGEYEVKVRSENQFGWSEDSKITHFRVFSSGHHHGYKQHPTHKEEHNNIIETPPEPALDKSAVPEASSSAKIIPTTSLLLLTLLFLFNRH